MKPYFPCPNPVQLRAGSLSILTCMEILYSFAASVVKICASKLGDCGVEPGFNFNRTSYVEVSESPTLKL